MHRTLARLIMGTGAVGVVLAVLILPLRSAMAEGASGKDLYAKQCAMCHGKDGVAPEMWAKKGMKNLSDSAWQKEHSDDAIAKGVTDGIPDKKMPAYKDKLSREETDAIVKYIRTLAPAK